MDYLDELFTPLPPEAQAENAAYLERCATENEARQARLAAAEAEKQAYRLRPICGRCSGAGRLGAFMHRAGGVCFACRGSGRA